MTTKLDLKKIFRNRDLWIVVGGAAAAVTAIAVVSGKKSSTATPAYYSWGDQPVGWSGTQPAPGTPTAPSGGGSSPTPDPDPIFRIDPRESLPVSRGGFVPDDLWGKAIIEPRTPLVGHDAAATIPAFAIPAQISRPIISPPPAVYASDLAKPPAAGWTKPPVFQQTSPTNVIDTTGGKVGGVNPGNVFLGYSDPATGNLSKTPNGGPAIWA